MLPYDRAGTGEPLLLLHEVGGARTSWAALVAPLARHHDVVAVDLPGHGAAPAASDDVSPARLADAVAASMDELGWPTAHLVGASLGGWVALELACRGRARSVTALSPAGLWHDVDREMRGADRVAGLRSAARVLSPVAPALARIGPLRRAMVRGSVAHPERVTPDAFCKLVRAVSTARAWQPLAETMGRYKIPDEAAHIRVPVTVVWGEQDFTPDDARAVDRLPAHTHVVTAPDAGHMIHWDSPVATIGWVRHTVARTHVTGD